MPTRRVLAVVNPTAGGDPEQVAATLSAHPGADVEVCYTRSPGDGTRLIAETVPGLQPELVVAIGGDGTAGEVARGLYELGVEQPPPLLVGPGGTGNSSFRGVWEDRLWTDILTDVFAEGRTAVRPVDLIEVPELKLPALLGISTGIIPECLLVARGLELTGRERLLAAAVQAIETYRPNPVRVLVDDEELIECQCLLVTVGGSRYRAGVLEILPHSMLDDGLLDVCVIDASVTLVDLATAAANRGLDALPGIRYGRGRTIRIERTDGSALKLEHDGELELGDRDGYEARVIPAAIRMLVPVPVPVGFAPEPEPAPELEPEPAAREGLGR